MTPLFVNAAVAAGFVAFAAWLVWTATKGARRG